MEEQLKSIYLLYGEEEYLIEQAVKKIKKEFGELIEGINYIRIDETNLETVIPNIETPPFGYNKKLIIMRKTQIFKKTLKKYSDMLASYIRENFDVIKDNVVLIIIEDEINKNELYKTILELGVVHEFTKLKPNEAMQKIKSICNAYKVNIDNSTLQYFIDTCGLDFQTLINEIRKLIEYAGPNGTITKEQIDLLSIKEFDSIIFDLTDTLGKKDIKSAVEILKGLIYNKEPVQKILITLYNHFKKIYITMLAQEKDKNIAESLNLKPNQIFLVTKYKNQARYFKKDELKKILQELIELDYKTKQGKIDLEIGLEAILCTYCG